MNNKETTWKNLVTFIDAATGGIKKHRVKIKSNNREKVVEEILERNHYDYVETRKGISKSDFIDEGSRWLVDKIEISANTEFDHVMRKGVPDFCVGDPVSKQMYFIEVKRPEHGLRSSQLRWMRLFDSLPVKIAYVENKKDWGDQGPFG